MVLPVYVYGSKILHQQTKSVTEEELFDPSNSVKQLISDMIDTMNNGEGIGLAANQVGRTESIIVLNAVFLEENGITNVPSVLINPEIVWRSDEPSTLTRRRREHP